MYYLQIDDFNGNINIISRDDGSGEPLIFDNLREAENTLNENCHNGVIVPLIDSISLFKRVNDLFNSSKLIIEEESTEDERNFITLKNDLKNILKYT